MTKFNEKSFSVVMNRGTSDLKERWEQTFGKREAVANPPAVITPDPPRELLQLYYLLNVQSQLGSVQERDALRTALVVIWNRLSIEERRTAEQR